VPSRGFGIWVGIGALSLGVALAAVAACADEKPSAPAKADPARDLSKFPRLQGKVEQVLGNVGSFLPPKGGESFQLELKDVTKLTSLPFDAARKSYIPLPGPVIVGSMNYYSNGAFQSMHLVWRKGRNLVTIDVAPKPGLGAKRVLVWVIVQSEVVEGVALIDCEYEGAFPDRAK
jgi:hypothetical protein